MLLQNCFDSINSQTFLHTEEIARLQAEVSRLQQHAQAVQSADKACESAVAQVRTALQMLAAICPDDVAVFRAAIDAEFVALPKLSAHVQVEKDGSSLVTYDEMKSLDLDILRHLAKVYGYEIAEKESRESIVLLVMNDCITRDRLASEIKSLSDEQPTETEVTIEPSPQSEPPTEPIVVEPENNNALQCATQADFVGCTLKTLRKLAERHGVEDFKQKQKDVLCRELDGLVTIDELDEVLSSGVRGTR